MIKLYSLIAIFNLLANILYPGQALKQHVFKFFINPDLVSSMAFIKDALPKYVDDLNNVLSKTTLRRLIFDPNKDIVLTYVQPHTNVAAHPLPEEGFEIWAHIVMSDMPYSYGGYAGVDISGAGVLGGLRWAKIYDPSNISGSDLLDYWTQINNMLHELAHIFGAGSGEYYSLAKVLDTTGVFPIVNIDVFDCDDSFWKDKPDFLHDPLLLNAVQAGLNSREALIEYTKYSSLTSAILNGNYRNGISPVDNNISLGILSNSRPIDLAHVEVWSIVAASPYTATKIYEFTSVPGSNVIPWGVSGDPHNNFDNLRLIKVSKPGYLPTAKYVSIYDVDIAKIVYGKDILSVDVFLQNSTFLPILINGR